MARSACIALGIVLGSWAGFASAQEGGIQLPTIRFAEPPELVVAEPGLQVVPDQPDEIFYTEGWYWTRQGGHWFRTHDYRGQWVLAERRIVPDRLYRVPEGRYRYWQGSRSR